MVCITNCAIGFALVGGTIATALVTKNDVVFQQYHKTLDPIQKQALERISNERLTLYIQGTLLGLVLVGILSLMVDKSISPMVNVSSFAAIVLLTQYFYYILMQNSD